MSFAPSVAISQNIGSPSIVAVTDTSTGSDGAIVSRHVFLQTADNTYLVPSGTTTDYTNWLISAGTTKSINALDKDYALLITVNWVDINGATLYTKQGLYILTMYNEQYYYQLTQDQVATPNIVNDSNYYNNKGILRTEIDSANQAVLIGGDIYAAQNCLERATFMVNNANLFF